MQPDPRDPSAPRRILRRTLLGGLSLPFLATRQAGAQGAYPNRPVRFVVPFTPGSGAELATRFVGGKFTEITGQPAVIEPRGGGNGFIGVQAVLSSPRDGYTLLAGSNATLATNAALFRTLPYDPIVDFEPVSMMIQSPILLVVPASSPHRTLADVVDAAKARSGQLNIATGSAGYQLMAALLAQKAGFTFVNVPYKSAPEAVIGVVTGQVDLGVADITSVIGMVRGGQVRPLAIASERRHKALPDLPTAEEARVAGFTAAPWNAVAAPRDVPEAVVRRLSDLFVQIMAMPETRAFFDEQLVEIMPSGQEAMRRYQREEVAKWKRIAADARIEPQ